MSKVRLEVIEEDVSLGLPREPGSCAFAMALRRKFPFLEPKIFLVGDEYHARLYETVGGIMPAHQIKVTYVLSKNAAKQVRQFDQVGVMDPGTFELTTLS